MGRQVRTAVTAVLLGLCGAACTRASVEPPFTLKQVGPDIWAAIHNPKAASPAWANAGFVIGDDGVAVIDTFASEATATALLAEIRARTTLPVKYVINTHYHSDHVAGNGVFANAGAIVLAQRQVRGWIHSENLRLLGPTITPEQRATTEAFVAPTVVYDHGANLFLGSRRIQLRSFPGHTGGDSIVVIPDSRVVFAGDLLFHDMLPTLVDASMRPWIDTLDALLAQYAGFTFVPGHGDVGHSQDVTAFREYLLTLHTLVTDAKARGKSGDGHMEFFEHVARQNVLETDAELNGTKRLPPALQ